MCLLVNVFAIILSFMCISSTLAASDVAIVAPSTTGELVSSPTGHVSLPIGHGAVAGGASAGESLAAGGVIGAGQVHKSGVDAFKAGKAGKVASSAGGASGQTGFSSASGAGASGAAGAVAGKFGKVGAIKKVYASGHDKVYGKVVVYGHDRGFKFAKVAGAGAEGGAVGAIGAKGAFDKGSSASGFAKGAKGGKSSIATGAEGISSFNGATADASGFGKKGFVTKSAGGGKHFQGGGLGVPFPGYAQGHGYDYGHHNSQPHYPRGHFGYPYSSPHSPSYYRPYSGSHYSNYGPY